MRPDPVVKEIEENQTSAALDYPVGYVNLQRLMAAIVLVAVCAELAYTTVNISAMPVFIPSIGLAPQWIGIAATSFILMEGVLKSPFGVLGDRVGRRILILTGPCVSIFTCLLTPHIHNPYVLILLRILDGIGAAALWPAAFSLIGDHIPESRRSTAMSYFNLAYLVGLALGPMLGGGVNDLYFRLLLKSHSLPVPVGKSWSQTAQLLYDHSKVASFYVAALLFVITTTVASLFIPILKPVEHTDDNSTEGGFQLNSFSAMLRRIPMTLLMTFTTFFGIGLIMAYVKSFCLNYFHFTETHFGLLLIIPALIIAALSVPLGTLGDKIGKARAVKIGIGLCALSYWLLLIFFQEWSLIVFGATLGIGFVIAFPAWMAIVSCLCDSNQRGAAIGAVGTAQGLGAISGVLISSFLYKYGVLRLSNLTIPEHGLPFLCCGIMLGISFLLAVITVKDPHDPTAKQGKC